MRKMSRTVFVLLSNVISVGTQQGNSCLLLLSRAVLPLLWFSSCEPMDHRHDHVTFFTLTTRKLRKCAHGSILYFQPFLFSSLLIYFKFILSGLINCKYASLNPFLGQDRMSINQSIVLFSPKMSFSHIFYLRRPFY